MKKEKKAELKKVMAFIPPPNPLIPGKKKEIQRIKTSSGFPYEFLPVTHHGLERENEYISLDIIDPPKISRTQPE